MSTITSEQEQSIRAWLDEHPTLAVGVGAEEQACSVAAINLALSGELTDRIPGCMSQVIGRWIIGIQDRMPAEIRNSPAWRSLLPLAAGTGRNREAERLQVILTWMWERVLPTVQPIADKRGFGGEWREMLTERTASAARRARKAAADAAYAYAYAYTAADAADAADAAAADAAYADAAYAAAYAAAHAAYAVGGVDAVYAADAADAAVRAQAWSSFDPVGLLKELIETGES